MASTTTKPDLDVTTPFSGAGVPAWPLNESASALSDYRAQDSTKPSQRDALQALLAFSALHEQLRRRKALANRNQNFDAGAPLTEFSQDEQFVLSEVLQLVAERAIAITGADGLAIALAENNEIVLRAAAGTVRPDIGARIDRDSAFSGACFRTAQTVNCDDTETDPRVNLEACRKLGARSMVAVPLCGRRRVIGVLEAFSAWPFGFNDTDVRNLTLLAELVLGALKPEDEDRFADSAQAAATKLEPAAPPAKTSAHNRSTATCSRRTAGSACCCDDCLCSNSIDCSSFRRIDCPGARRIDEPCSRHSRRRETRYSRSRQNRKEAGRSEARLRPRQNHSGKASNRAGAKGRKTCRRRSRCQK